MAYQVTKHDSGIDKGYVIATDVETGDEIARARSYSACHNKAKKAEEKRAKAACQ